MGWLQCFLQCLCLCKIVVHIAQAQSYQTPPTSDKAVTISDATYTENFGTPSSSGPATVTPDGWYFLEQGVAADGMYSNDPGFGRPDTYAIGSMQDLAFGSLSPAQSLDFNTEELRSFLGAQFVNGGATAITRLSIAYRAEQWFVQPRPQADIGKVDKLEFQYSTDAINMSTGTWVNVTALDAESSVVTGYGNLDGNQNYKDVSGFIDLSQSPLPPGGRLWIRWVDYRLDTSVLRYDDLLAVDDFSLTAEFEAPTCCAGYYYNTTLQECTTCPANTFQQTRDIFVTACTPCPDDKPSSYVGTARGVDCNNCAEGFYWQPYTSPGCIGNCCPTPPQQVAFLPPPNANSGYGECLACPTVTTYDPMRASQGLYPCMNVGVVTPVTMPAIKRSSPVRTRRTR